MTMMICDSRGGLNAGEVSLRSEHDRHLLHGYASVRHRCGQAPGCSHHQRAQQRRAIARLVQSVQDCRNVSVQLSFLLIFD